MTRRLCLLISKIAAGSIIYGRVACAQDIINLKKIFYVMVGVCVLLKGVMITYAVAAPLPGGDTQVALIDEYKVKIGLQHRVMWNYSNIPLSGVTTAADTKDYDFFRQRLRFNLDVQPIENIGSFLQLEYRGGWGGSSPANSDPRGVGLTLNAFNRLQTRGVRYGYIYYTPGDETCLAAGVIPVSDRVGDVLFSADWDFNVGGISFNSTAGSIDYRLAYLRVVDGVSSLNSDVAGDNMNLYVADIQFPELGFAKLGAHIYYLNASKAVAIEAGLPGKVSQGWYALSGSGDIQSVNLNGFIIINNGSYGTFDNTGVAVKTEAVIPLGDPAVKVMGVYATGDKEGTSPESQFRTIQGIFGTEGFWAYTHLFTANGPSDVNDLGAGLDNGGCGLFSIQAKVETPLVEKLTGELFAGWFQASADNSDGNKEMGIELGGMLTNEIAKHFNLQLGAAFAFLGDYYKSSGQNPDNLSEVFARFQLQF